MNARIHTIDPKAYGRLIAVSDLHGADDAFVELLGKIGFSQDDALILLGDYIERGEQSLPLLRRIMAFSACGNVFALLGNCDTLLDDLFFPRFRGDLLRYLTRHPRTVLHEMLEEQGVPFSDVTTLEQLRETVARHYAAERMFLCTLPHIIAAGPYVFVHAGLDAGVLEGQDDDRCMKRQDFYDTAPAFPFHVVVGHMPCQRLPGQDGTPVFDDARNLIFIDGGSNVMEGGRLNALILEGETRSVVSVVV